MKKSVRMILAIAVAVCMMLSCITAYAAGPGNMGNQQPGQFGGDMGMPGQMGGNITYASSQSEIITTTVTNTAQNLVADKANAATYDVSETSQVKITEAGTYIVTGTCSDGNITVKKGTTGVVLILKDLDLTSTTGATVSLNKGSEVKLIIEGTVKLTDAENPADEDSTDADVADAFDGAALKAKSGSNVYLTGSGSLTIDGSSCKNGIKVGDADDGIPSFVIDGGLTINITAANDAINGGYDVTILSGTLNISAGDDGIHADRILTIGSNGNGPTINVNKSYEGMEGTVVNLFGGKGTVNASDDAINAANSDGTFCSEMDYSINITGGTWTVRCSADGLDSNGNVNLISGSLTITSANNGGDAGIDYDGSLYISDEFNLVNNSGISGPYGGAMGGPGGQGNSQQPGNQNGIAAPDGSTAGGPGGRQQPETQAVMPQDNLTTGKTDLPNTAGNSGEGSLFSDVNASAYYYDAVVWAAENGFTNGTGDGKFTPDSTVTRAEAVTFLWRIQGCPEPVTDDSGFSDVEEGSWYEKAVIWAVEQGITNGTGDQKFTPWATLTRNQLITLIWRMMGEPNKTGAGTWYMDAENWASQEGILSGTSTAYVSTDDCPRKDVVFYLYRKFA